MLQGSLFPNKVHRGKVFMQCLRVVHKGAWECVKVRVWGGGESGKQAGRAGDPSELVLERRFL